jgi:hypothetical protein
VILDLGGNKLGHEYLWRKRGGHGGGGAKMWALGAEKWCGGNFLVDSTFGTF